MKARRLLGYGAAAAGVGMASFGAWSAVAWTRYGHTDPERYPRDELLDRFIPNPEVDEYHQLEVDAPAPITFAVAKAMDLQASPIVRGVFWLRAVPVGLRPLPPAAFAGFDEPGYVKIVWTLAAEPLGPNRSRFVARTRVVTTGPESRRRYRRYWAPMSAGIILIRYVSLPMVKREAERWARHRRGDQPPADPGGRGTDMGDATGSASRVSTTH